MGKRLCTSLLEGIWSPMGSALLILFLLLFALRYVARPSGIVAYIVGAVTVWPAQDTSIEDSLRLVHWPPLETAAFRRISRIAGVAASSVTVLRLLGLCCPCWLPPTRRTYRRQPPDIWKWHTDSSSLAERIRAVGLRLWRCAQRDDASYGVITRGGLARWFAGVLYVGILMFVLAAPVRALFGWTGPTVTLRAGETAILQAEPALFARLDSAEQRQQQSSEESRPSRVSLVQNGETVAHLVLGRHRRAHYAGVSIYHLGSGPAIKVSASLEKGDPLVLQRLPSGERETGIVRLTFPSPGRETFLALPQRELTMRLVLYADPSNAHTFDGKLHVQIFRGPDSSPIVDEMLTRNRVLRIGDTLLGFAFEELVVIRAERDPDFGFAVLGMGLILLGFVASLLRPPIRVYLTWLHLRDGIECRVYASARERRCQWYQCLEAMLSESGDRTP